MRMHKYAIKLGISLSTLIGINMANMIWLQVCISNTSGGGLHTHQDKDPALGHGGDQ